MTRACVIIIFDREARHRVSYVMWNVLGRSLCGLDLSASCWSAAQCTLM